MDHAHSRSWRSVPGEVRPSQRSAHSRGALYRSTLYRNQFYLFTFSPSLHGPSALDHRHAAHDLRLTTARISVALNALNAAVPAAINSFYS